MPRIESIRSDVQRLIRTVPFRPFILSMENVERAVIEHPENVAFDPVEGGSDYFHVVTGRLRLISTFGSVTSIILADRDGTAA